MSNSDKGVYLDKLIDNILNTKLEDIPAATVDHAKNRLFDVIGCMICGANDYGNPELLEVIRDWGGKPEARIFVHGHKVPAPMAALVNCVMARSFDYEPVSPLVDGKSIPGHISGTTTMTALTVGDMLNVSGKELLTAMLVGDDMATRVLLTGEAGGTRRGFDHVGQANSFGATAIAGRMMGLNHEQVSDAFGLVVDHLGGVQRQIGDTTVGFKLSQGNAARDAIFSVKLAEYSDAVRAVAREEDVPLVDVFKAFREYDGVDGRSVDELFVDGMHPNDKGHAIIAEMLVPVVEKACRANGEDGG